MPTAFEELSASTREALTAGLACFNAGLFWEAHEAWEAAWLEEEGDTRLWLQGLIQLTAAFHKGLRMGNPSGMGKLFGHAAEKFQYLLSSGDQFGGLSLAGLLQAAQAGEAEARRCAADPTAQFNAGLIPQLTIGQG